MRIGILGCGTIGSGIAKSIHGDVFSDGTLAAIYDIDQHKSASLARDLGRPEIIKPSFDDLLNHCDLMVEAVDSTETLSMIKQAINAGKTVLAMSVGKLIDASDIFDLAESKKIKILIPSGAVAGIDAIKSASQTIIHKAKLITRKPPRGLIGNPYFENNKIDIENIEQETLVFKGNVDEAVKYFPQNMNVAATIALALPKSIRHLFEIRIHTGKTLTTNSHEIYIQADSGTITTRTDNVPSPDNPKTSYLAVLSGIQTLRQFCTYKSVIGT